MIEITIPGRIPSKKNSRLTLPRGNRVINIPSNEHREWEKKASASLYGVRRIEFVSGMRLVFFMPDNRKCDLTNKAESIMDLLVKYKIIKDDSWQFVGYIELCSCGIDKINPRVNIKIWEKTDGQEKDIL